MGGRPCGQMPVVAQANIREQGLAPTKTTKPTSPRTLHLSPPPPALVTPDSIGGPSLPPSTAIDKRQKGLSALVSSNNRDLTPIKFLTGLQGLGVELDSQRRSNFQDGGEARIALS